MSRPLRELIDDYDADPARWQIVRSESVLSTNRRNRGGSSVQEVLRHKATGEEMIRHSLLKPDGTYFDEPHFRLEWKP